MKIPENDSSDPNPLQLPVPPATVPAQVPISNEPSDEDVAQATLLASLRVAGKFRHAPCSPVAAFVSLASHHRKLIATAGSVAAVAGKAVAPAVPVQTAKTPAVAVMVEVEPTRAGVSP